MANLSRPFGFRAIRTLDSNDYNGQAGLYWKSGADGSNVFMGDLVRFDGTNRNSGPTTRFPGLMAVQQFIAGGAQSIGVVVGIVPQPEFNQIQQATLGLRYMPGTSGIDRWLFVIDDAAVLYEIEDDWGSDASASTAFTTTIGKNADISGAANGSTITGVSGMRLATATIATTATLPMRVYRWIQRDNNLPAQAQGHWEVRLQTQLLYQVTGQ